MPSSRGVAQAAMIVVCVLVLCAFLAAVTWLAGDALVQLVASLADDGTGGSQ